MTRVTDRELELQAEVDRLCGTLFKAQQEIDRLRSENAQLGATTAIRKLAKAREALEAIAEGEYGQCPHIARRALKEIEP